MHPPPETPFLMLTELFLPTKGGTAVSFDDDFRRLGGKEIHVVTADVPGAAEFDRTHPNTIHRLALQRVRVAEARIAGHVLEAVRQGGEPGGNRSLHRDLRRAACCPKDWWHGRSAGFSVAPCWSMRTARN